MKNKYKILILIGGILILSSFLCYHFGVLDYFNVRSNKVYVNIDNSLNELIRNANFQIEIASLDTIKVDLKSKNFLIEGFPDLYGKDYIAFSIDNHKKYYHFNEYKFKSYHKVKFYIFVYEESSNIVLDWKLKSLNKSLSGQDIIELN